MHAKPVTQADYLPATLPNLDVKAALTPEQLLKIAASMGMPEPIAFAKNACNAVSHSTDTSSRLREASISGREALNMLAAYEPESPLHAMAALGLGVLVDREITATDYKLLQDIPCTEVPWLKAIEVSSRVLLT